jgi:hypothetical protein
LIGARVATTARLTLCPRVSPGVFPLPGRTHLIAGERGTPGIPGDISFTDKEIAKWNRRK